MNDLSGNANKKDSIDEIEKIENFIVDIENN